MQLEAELSSVQSFLNSRSAGGSPPPYFDGNINYDPPGNSARVAGNAAASSKPKTLDELLSYLENAPEGPVELDPNLLYSPRSSINDSVSGSEPSLSRFHTERPPSATPTLFTQRDEEAPLHQPTAAGDTAMLSNRAYISKQRALQRLDTLRREKQVAEMAECTFAPLTGRPPIGPRAQPHLKVEDRLLLTAGQRKEEAARRLHEERDEAERASCPFVPQLVAPPDRHIREPRRPIHERLNEEWRRKEAVMAEATAKANEGASFKPTLNPASIRLAAKKRCQATEKGPTTKQALYTPAEATFQPSINPVSTRMVEMSANVPSDFHRRQRHFDRRRQEHRQVIATTALTEGNQCTFHPETTGTATTVLALSNRRFCLAVEEPEQRWDRMAVVESEIREARLKAKSAQVHAEEASFIPKLNPRSLRLAESKSRPSLVEVAVQSTNERLAALETRRAEAAARELQGCTFFPNTSKPRVVGYYDEYEAPAPRAPLSIAAVAEEGFHTLSQRIDEHREQKERWAEAMRAQEANKQLAECTFAPNISKPVVEIPQGPVAVPGLDRYLEVKAMAEKRQAEADARAAKVFLTKPRSPRSRGPTVVKPFKFASGERRREMGPSDKVRN